MAASTNLKNLSIHLEKIAYGTAAVLFIVILLLPSLFSTSIKTQDLNDGRGKVEARIESDIPEVQQIPDVKGQVEKQWATADVPAGWIPAWTEEARPAVVRLSKGAVEKIVSHEAGKVAKITARRDAAKNVVILQVEATRGTLKEGKFTATKLLRKVIPPAADAKSADGKAAAAEEPKFVLVKEFPADQPIKYEDASVVPGSTYAYQIVTAVAPVGTAKLESADKEKSSKELAITKPIPWEYAVKIISTSPFDAATNTPASLSGEVSYWDYAASKVAKSPKGTWKENDTFGPKKDGQDRYVIKQIDMSKVQVLDRWKLLKSEMLFPKDNKRAVDLPPEITYEAAEAAEAAASKPPEEVVEEKAAEKPAAKAKKTSDDDTSDDDKPAKPKTKKVSDRKTPEKDSKKTDKKTTPKKRTIK
jgi:hypothetical protein